MRRIFYLLFLVGVVFLAFWVGEDITLKKGEMPTFFPQKGSPVSEERVLPKRSFVVALYGAKDPIQTLKSVFAQKGEMFRVVWAPGNVSKEEVSSTLAWAEEEGVLDRIEQISDEGISEVQALYKIAKGCQEKEILVPLKAGDTLLYAHLFEELEKVYQDSVWMTLTHQGARFTQEVRQELSQDPAFFGKLSSFPISFEAALFQQLKLAELDDRYDEALFQMAKNHVTLLETKEPRVRCETSKKHYPKLKSLSKKESKGDVVDLVLFSFDRPFQLYACLESIERHIQGMGECSVVYRSSNASFEAGYQEVKRAFPWATFLSQSHPKKKDFKPTTLKATFDTSSDYVLFGVDDIVVKEDVDLKAAAKSMEETGAYGVYLRLGKNIRISYQTQKAQEIPKSIEIDPGMHAWHLDQSESDWHFANTLDMTLYRKGDLQKIWRRLKFNSPNGLEKAWASEYRPNGKMGLYYTKSKIMNVPLNVVTQTGNPHMNFMSAEELLGKFEEGLKMDLEPLEKVENTSPHFEVLPTFIPR